MEEGVVAIGLVVGLDYPNPMFDPYLSFQRFKQQPLVAALLQGGTRVRYGAKALPEGGWHAIPQVHLDGALIAGDAGGFLNALRLKGIHLAMRTGMLAADAAFAAVRDGDTSAAGLRRYQDAIDAGAVRRELYPVRNVRQAFTHGLAAGLAFAGWSLVSRGWWFRDPMPTRAGHERLEKLGGRGPASAVPAVTLDRQTTFDRNTSVHFSGTRHREDQPSHLLVHDLEICRTRCTVEYGNPCTRFCPANVYEMVDDGQGGRRLHISASNCVHCRTCDIMDPYQIVDWVPPEGGEGPRYVDM
jgi:electron-transferring-flavoprotein dehydrogenase